MIDIFAFIASFLVIVAVALIATPFVAVVVRLLRIELFFTWLCDNYFEPVLKKLTGKGMKP